MIIELATLAFLGAGSVLDIRNRRISLLLTAVYGFAAAALSSQGVENTGKGLSFLAGLLAALYSVLTRGALGMGDAVVIAVVGIPYGTERLFTLLLIAFVSCGLTSAVLLAAKRKSKNDSLPFLPFLFIGAVLSAVLR